MVKVSSSRIKNNDIKDHAYQFFQMSEDGFWCFVLEEPMPLTLPKYEQVQHILNHAKVYESNTAMARIYGYSSKEELVGVSFLELTGDSTENFQIQILQFIEANYKLQNFETNFLVNHHPTKYLLSTIYGEVQDDQLMRIWGSQKDITEIKLSQVKLEKMLFLEKLLGKISKSFLAVNPETIDEIINSCLMELGKIDIIDRSYVFIIQADGHLISNTNEWCREGIQAHIHELQNIPFQEEMPSSWNGLNHENMFKATTQDKDLHLTEHEHFLMKSQSIQSFLLVGIRNEGRLIGFVGFDCVRSSYIWTEEDISLLNIFSDLLSFALQNVKFQVELLEKDKSLLEFYDRINDDLEIAKETQKNLVSLDFPSSDQYHLTSFFRPFEEVGGDVINYHMHENYIDLMFGDVSGHGISSAMVSGMVILSFRNSSRLNETPAQILSSMNRDLKKIVLNHHITAACVRYYFQEKKVVYSYAGHPPLVLINRNDFQELPGMNTPLLTLENIEYFEKELHLTKGSRLVFYSDGCYEVFNSNNQLLGLYPFFDILKKESKIKDSTSFIQNSISKILQFSNGEVNDDLTMLVLDVH